VQLRQAVRQRDVLVRRKWAVALLLRVAAVELLLLFCLLISSYIF
jgi:hypothetical protein